MAKKKVSKADSIRDFLGKHPEGSLADFMEKTGIEASHSQFSGIKKQVQESGSMKSTVQSSGTSKRSSSNKRIEQLEHRIKYLEWVRIGEREGFVDELLREFEEEEE